MRYLLFLFFIVYSTMASANNDQIPQIQVTGTATQAVVPDQLQWHLRVKNAGQSVSDVANKHTEYVRTVLQYLTQEKLPEKDISTSHMQLQENWVYRGNSSVREGYFASTSISFRSKDFNQYTEIWKTLSSLDKVEIDSVSFGISNIDLLQEKLKVQAILNARKQAEELAKALGASLGEPLFISDQYRSTPFSDMNRSVPMMAKSSESDNAIVPGEQKVTASIFTSFRLISH